MLRTRPDTESAPDAIEQDDSIWNHLIPLSHLTLDLPDPGGGWTAYLTRAGHDGPERWHWAFVDRSC
jgi:hypothetical protein